MFAAEEPVAASAVANGPDDESGRQLRIFRESLLRGASEQIRVDAALELLRKGDRAAMEVLVGALVSTENRVALGAVCRGIIKSRTLSDVTGNREEFIEPLFSVLVGKNQDDALLAAEALAVFEYEQVGARLALLAGSTELDTGMRINAIYALKLWTSKESINEIAKLVVDDEPQVASAAEQALREIFGLPEGTSRDRIINVVNNLQSKRPVEIMRDLMVVQRERLAAQKEQLRQLQGQREQWQRLYLGALDKEYEILADNAARGKILVERLGSEFSPVKLWALEKLSNYAGTLPEGLRSRLLMLISDPERQVRLATAKALSKMSALDPAEKLLEQFRVEQDATVMLAILEAMGEACYFASSPGSPVTISEQIKEQTLAAAATYLEDTDAEKSRIGAEVIRKLLELNSLPEVKVQEYIGMIAAVYEKSRDNPAKSAGLMAVMARLCGAGSSCRDEAVKIFRDYFIGGVGSANGAGAVREAAVTGLINTDKVEALRLLKEKGYSEDENIAIRKAVIELAGQVGGIEDLEWLSGKIGSGADSEWAWQSIVEILKRQSGEAAAQWAEKLGGFIEAGQLREILEIAERKAEAEKNEQTLISVRLKLFDWYSSKSQYEQIIAYADKLLTADSEQVNKTSIEIEKLRAQLETSQFEQVQVYVSQVLAKKKDIGQTGPAAVAVGEFISSEQVSSEAKTHLIEVLSAIKVEGSNSPVWRSKLQAWQEIVGSAGEDLTNSSNN